MHESVDYYPFDNCDDYWDFIAQQYHEEVSISCDDFHFGPLIPGDRQLRVLPPLEKQMPCLELGCGGAQNSIYLARQGACCAAVDKSARQLARARKLAQCYQVEIDFTQADLNCWEPELPEESIGLIHSSYAMAFLEAPGRLIQKVVPLLRPGGRLLLSSAHPLANAEKIETEDGERGVFVQNYFSVAVDQRIEGNGKYRETCRAWPLSEMAAWLTEAGLVITRMLEPKPLTGRQPAGYQPPYDSFQWREYSRDLNLIPAVVVFLAYKP